MVSPEMSFFEFLAPANSCGIQQEFPIFQKKLIFGFSRNQFPIFIFSFFSNV